MLTPQIAYYLDKKIEELQNHYLTNIVGKELYICEKIILFFAAFYKYFPAFIKKIINNLYYKYESENINSETSLFVHKFATLIILQKLVGNENVSFEYYCNYFLDYLSHHSSSNRSAFSILTLFLLNNEIEPELQIEGYSLKEHLIYHCEENIRKRHGGNIDSYALISFLNISAEEKIEIFNTLYKRAIERDHDWDFQDLELLKKGDNKIENPFYEEFIELQQIILNELSQIIVPDNFDYVLGEQLNIFENKKKRKLENNFNLKDARLQKYLII